MTDSRSAAIVMDMDRLGTHDGHGDYGTLTMTASLTHEIPAGEGRVIACTTLIVPGRLELTSVIQRAHYGELGQFIFHTDDWSGLSWHLTLMDTIARSSGVVVPRGGYLPQFDDIEGQIRANPALASRLLDHRGRALNGQLVHPS